MINAIQTLPVAPTVPDIEKALQAGFDGARSLTEALVQAYYQRDIDAVKRIAAQAEYRLSILSHLVHDQDMR